MTMATVIVIRLPGIRLNRAHCNALLRNVLGVDGTHAHLCHAMDSPETYIYLADFMHPAVSKPATITNAMRSGRTLTDAIAQYYPNASSDLLQQTLDLRGQAWGKTARCHYVVETDIDPAAEADFNDWYTQEHLPGLAAVPGTVRAMRLYNNAGTPRYHALYLLQTQQTFGSSPWLAVRGTDWSSRVRPHFLNTKRTMFNIIE